MKNNINFDQILKKMEAIIKIDDKEIYNE